MSTTINVSNDVTRIFELNETLTGAYSVLHADSGKTFFLNAAAGAAISMPALKAGANYKFVVAAAFATSDWVITPSDAGKLEGSLVVAGDAVTVAAGNSFTFELGAENVGDFVEVTCDGSTWFVNGVGLTGSSITIQS
tara:strand:- start:939 stop:1352 length:414 start_codon:yes stop_codon:yes gene_type:complete